MANQMTIDAILREWKSKERRMGCVSATRWFCARANSFHPKRIARYTKDGAIYEHIVATDGSIVIDLAPYADRPTSEE